MDNFAYMILIGALLVLAAWMLYARFAARSRENSLHHGPGKASNEDYAEAVVEDEVESSVIEEGALAATKKEDPVPSENDSVGAEIVAVEEHLEKNKEEEYFDELQEAAAGLAVLMRSSPVSNRTTPVVFAPEVEGEKVGVTDAEETLSTAVMVSEPLVPKSGAVAEGSKEEETTESTVNIEDEVIPGEAEVTVSESDIRFLLGDEVGDQFERIDSGLDSLEELVLSIASGMAAFEGLDEESATDNDGEGDVSEAA